MWTNSSNNKRWQKINHPYAMKKKADTKDKPAIYYEKESWFKRKWSLRWIHYWRFKKKLIPWEVIISTYLN